MRFVILIILSSQLVSVEILAEDRDWRSFVESGGNNYDMKQNASEATDELDTRMRQIIKTFKFQDETERELFQLNQGSWFEYAKSKADFMADTYRTGSHFGLAHGYVMIDEFVKRIIELKAMKLYKELP